MIQGVKANNYNATFEEAAFDVIEWEKVYEIREINSGITFFIEKGAFSDKGRSETRTARFEGNVKGHKVHRRRDRKANDGSDENDDFL